MFNYKKYKSSYIQLSNLVQIGGNKINILLINIRIFKELEKIKSPILIDPSKISHVNDILYYIVDSTGENILIDTFYISKINNDKFTESDGDNEIYIIKYGANVRVLLSKKQPQPPSYKDKLLNAESADEFVNVIFKNITDASSILYNNTDVINGASYKTKKYYGWSNIFINKLANSIKTNSSLINENKIYYKLVLDFAILIEGSVSDSLITVGKEANISMIEPLFGKNDDTITIIDFFSKDQ